MSAINKSGFTELKDKNELIRAMIAPIRFEQDGSGYFSVHQNTTNITFPVKPAAQGKDLGEVKDKNNVYVIKDLSKKAKDGGGFVNYI